MYRRVVCILVMLGILLSFSSCGYNGIMHNHLSNSDNYSQYRATIIGVYYEYEENVLSDSFQSDDIANVKHVYLDVTLETKAEIAPFYGVSESGLDKDCSEYIIRLKIISENAKILAENGFFGDVKAGDQVTLKASNWIYQDSPFFYVSSVTYGETDYLSESTGLENIVDMMQSNRSLF